MENQNYSEENRQNEVAYVSNGKGFSIAALILGIASMVLAWFTFVNIAALVGAILGIVFACKGRKCSVAANGKPSGLATAGLVLSIIGTVIAGIGFMTCTLCTLCVAGAAASAADSLNSLF